MSLKLLGIILLIIGAAMIAYTGFNYVTNDTVMQIGDISIDKQTKHPVQWSPYVGGALLVCGIVLMLSAKKQNV
ncbi:MAG: hypothetical protein H7101_08715 [Deinococcales bacterium]|nr:hypothetical protein [Chitinophagaceae bacterium]